MSPVKMQKQRGFTLIETMIGAALLTLLIGFTLQVQTRFAQNVQSQEREQCLASRILRVKKQVYALRPANEIEVQENCPAPQGSQTDVNLTTVSGTYPPAADQDCAEIKVSILLNGKERFVTDAFPCNY